MACVGNAVYVSSFCGLVRWFSSVLALLTLALSFPAWSLYFSGLYLGQTLKAVLLQPEPVLDPHYSAYLQNKALQELMSGRLVILGACVYRQ